MFGIGASELILTVMIIFLLFGTKGLPQIARSLAEAIKLFKGGVVEDKNEGQKADGAGKNAQPCVISINISKGGIPKWPVSHARIGELGLEGDAHNHEKHNSPVQAVCLQDMEKLEELQKEGYPLYPGTTGENLTLLNCHVNAVPLGTLLKFSSGVILEITKARKPCYVLDSINPKLKEDIVGRCGMYAKVIQEGTIQAGDRLVIMKNRTGV